MTGPRGRQLHARAAGARSFLARYTGFDWARGHYRRLPFWIRNWLPFALLLTLAVTYPFYVDNLPTNVPLILTFPDLHSAVTILVFVTLALWTFEVLMTD